MRRGKRKSEAHVRLYRHELESPAYRSLSTDARALLVEFRSLYNGRENRVYLSVRDMMKRLSIGQRRAQRARDDLIDRGFILLITPGGFSRKDRRASEYALTHEPLDDRDGATAPKDYMKWQSQKSTVRDTATYDTRGGYNNDTPRERKATHGSCSSYRDSISGPLNGSQGGYTDRLPRAVGFIGGAIEAEGGVQLKLIVAAFLAAQSK